MSSACGVEEFSTRAFECNIPAPSVIPYFELRKGPMYSWIQSRTIAIALILHLQSSDNEIRDEID